MAPTPIQIDVCQVISRIRHVQGESYVAGGFALNVMTGGTRQSRDIDLFHDTEEAVVSAWRSDREALNEAGFGIEVLQERRGHVEARVSRGRDSVNLEWAQDSAFRFFPLVEHEILGLTLHPVDLATNKTLALVGRLKARDWIDMFTSVREIQPLGFLAWAACGKDPGFGPSAIIEHAARSSRYSAEEIDALSFDGPAPDAGVLSREWHAIIADAREIVDMLPSDEAGRCVLGTNGNLLVATPDELRKITRDGALRFHPGSIRGAFPTFC